jgi:hypothetical protein
MQPSVLNLDDLAASGCVAHPALSPDRGAGALEILDCFECSL